MNYVQGTGKTMVVRALAKDCGARMLQVTGSSVNMKWVGEGEKRVNAVFVSLVRLALCNRTRMGLN